MYYMGYPLTITDGRPRHLQGRKQHDSLSRESLCPLRDESTLRESRRDERMPAARAELCRVELYHVVLMEVRTLRRSVRAQARIFCAAPANLVAFAG